MSSSFNKNHPELKEGEVFLTNTESDEYEFRFPRFDDFGHGFAAIGWKTKRKGSVAYDIYGKPVRGLIPVFVQREELKKGGIDPDNLFSDHVERKKINYKNLIVWILGIAVFLALIALAITNHL